MTIEAKSTQSSESSPDLEGLLTRLTQPLDLWSQVTDTINETEERYKGPQGLVKNLAKRFTDNASAFVVSKGKRPTEKNQKTFQRIAENRLLKALAPNVQSDLSHFEREALIRAKRISIPEEYRGLELSEEMAQLAEDYRQEISSPITTRNNSKDHLQKELTDWLAADFDHLLELERLAQLRNDPAKNLLRFLSANSPPLETGARLAREKELANPKDQRLITFFDQMAAAYYQQGRYAGIWPLIELSIALPADKIRSFYTGTSDVATRQQVLIAPLIVHWHQFQKTLPPLVRDQYAIYLILHQEETILKIQEAANEFRIKPPKLIPPADLSTLELAATNQEPADEAQIVDQSIDTGEVVKPHKVILIGGQVCNDEDSIKKSLEELFRTELKIWRPNDLNSYTLVLAKRAGLRINAFKHDLKKLKDFPRVPLSDGSQEPVLRFRLWDKAAPRLFITFHDNLLIVISATYRADNTYSQLMHKSGFGQIQLPP